VVPLTDFDLDAFLPFRLAVIAGQVSREFSRRYGERFGLSRAEWRVMAHLWQSGSASVREIHAEADLDKSRVSRAATRLEADGMVAKQVDPADGRLVRLTLTDSGRDMMTDLAAMARAYQDELVQRIGPGWEEISGMIDRLEHSADN
jgi:DNA-binding MarR family transcriptional regulator